MINKMHSNWYWTGIDSNFGPRCLLFAAARTSSLTSPHLWWWAARLWFGLDDLPVRLPKMMLLVLRAAGRCATRTSVSSQYCQCRVGSEGKQVPSSVQPATTFGYVVKPTNQRDPDKTARPSASAVPSVPRRPPTRACRPSPCCR